MRPSLQGTLVVTRSGARVGVLAQLWQAERMSAESDAVVMRLVVVAADGRRSCEWRIWTGSRKPSDDVYLAPRSLGDQLKVSLHRDGWCQHGFDPSIRGRLRSGDKHALDRWEIVEEIIPGWRPGYRLRFPESELEVQPDVDDDVTQIPASPADHSLMLDIFISEPSAVPIPTGGDAMFRVVATLNRKSGGSVTVLASVHTFDPTDVAEAVDIQRASISWDIPGGLREETFGWALGVADDGTRCCTEICMSKYTLPETVAPLPPFVGEVRPWPELPAAIQAREDLCGLLICRPTAQAILFVDQRSRCDHSRLGKTAEELRQSYLRGEIDKGWAYVGSGCYQTALSTPRLFQEGCDSGTIPLDVGVGGWPPEVDSSTDERPPDA